MPRQNLIRIGDLNVAWATARSGNRWDVYVLGEGQILDRTTFNMAKAVLRKRGVATTRVVLPQSS